LIFPRVILVNPVVSLWSAAKSKGRTFALNACHLNGATMLFDNVLHYRQPEAGSVSFGCKVRRKNGLQLFRCNSLPLSVTTILTRSPPLSFASTVIVP
jgi:hypothetical protein